MRAAIFLLSLTTSTTLGFAPSSLLSKSNSSRGMSSQTAAVIVGPLLAEPSRRDALGSILSSASTMLLTSTPAFAKCTDIESCREAGEAKDQEDLANHPIYSLSNGVQYKVLDKGSPFSQEEVSPDSTVDIAFSISQANGRYMYSKGFGFEKVQFAGQMQPDRDLSSLTVHLGRSSLTTKKRDVPVGIESVLVGMKKGEKRRIVLPPEVGFDTSDWQPTPEKRDAQRQLEVYRFLIHGDGAQPPFPAPTLWDVEVLRIRG